MRGIIIIILLLTTRSAALANDDLIGSTFVCPMAIYTFFPDNKYTANLAPLGVSGSMNTVSYGYDGTTLTLRYIGVDGKFREIMYKATYMMKKGKLILEDDDSQYICTER